MLETTTSPHTYTLISARNSLHMSFIPRHQVRITGGTALIRGESCVPVGQLRKPFHLTMSSSIHRRSASTLQPVSFAFRISNSPILYSYKRSFTVIEAQSECAYPRARCLSTRIKSLTCCICQSFSFRFQSSQFFVSILPEHRPRHFSNRREHQLCVPTSRPFRYQDHALSSAQPA